MATRGATDPRAGYAGWVGPLCWTYPPSFTTFAVVAAIGALSISMVNREPAPDEPSPITEEEADHAGERRTGRPRN